MKLSLWRQFSSNHSSSYTVVGEFKSVEEAQEAAKTITLILQENQSWYRQNNKVPYGRNGRKKPTPVEQRYSEEFGFDWQQTLDWSLYHFEETIEHYDRLVVIDTSSVDTWQTGHQFENLLRAMGANVAREMMGGIAPDGTHPYWIALKFKIKCRSESENRAQNLAEHFNSVFKELDARQDNAPIPWLVHHPGLAGQYSSQDIIQLQSDYLADRRSGDQIRKENPGATNQEFHTLWKKVRLLTHETWVHVRDCWHEVRFSSGSVSQNGTQLEFSKLRPGEPVIALHSFIAYLEALGCTDVTYTVYQP